MGEEPEGAEPVIGRYDDNPFIREDCPVIHCYRAVGSDQSKCPTIKEDHNRQFFIGILCRGPDIEVQAVLAHDGRWRSWCWRLERIC